MGYTICDLHCNSSVKRTFVHLTFNQVVAGSIPARPTNKSITTVEKSHCAMTTGLSYGFRYLALSERLKIKKECKWQH